MNRVPSPAVENELSPEALQDFGHCLRGERVLDTRLARRLAQAGIDLWDLPRSLVDRATSLALAESRFGLV